MSMGDIILIGVVLLAVLGGVGTFLYKLPPEDAHNAQVNPMLGSGRSVVPQVSSNVSHTSSPLNTTYLTTVREGSCYQVARQLHDVITVLAYVLTAVSVAVSLLISTRLDGGLVMGFLAVVFGILVAMVISIERSLFTALIDTADVVIDMGRHARKVNGEI